MKNKDKEYTAHMEACRLMVLVQGQVDEDVAEKVDLDTTLRELAEMGVEPGFCWEINRLNFRNK